MIAHIFENMHQAHQHIIISIIIPDSGLLG